MQQHNPFRIPRNTVLLWGDRHPQLSVRNHLLYMGGISDHTFLLPSYLFLLSFNSPAVNTDCGMSGKGLEEGDWIDSFFIYFFSSSLLLCSPASDGVIFGVGEFSSIVRLGKGLRAASPCCRELCSMHLLHFFLVCKRWDCCDFVDMSYCNFSSSC